MRANERRRRDLALRLQRAKRQDVRRPMHPIAQAQYRRERMRLAEQAALEGIDPMLLNGAKVKAGQR